MKRGFTLVELSIVLVIIGLLIGGILVAQSMISTTKIQGVIRQLSQYDVAIANFETKYGQLPGDDTLFPPLNAFYPFGNNDGTVDFNESAMAWNHLSLGVDLKNNDGNNFQAEDRTSVTEAGCPHFNINQESPAAPDVRCLFFVGTPAHYEYRDDHNLSNGGSPYDPLTIVDAVALDTKLDDGNLNTGNVTGYSVVSRASPCQWQDMTQIGYICSMTFALGVTNGMHQ